MVCRNPDLSTERARKRAELLVETETDLGRIKAAVSRKRNPLCGTADIAAEAPPDGLYVVRTSVAEATLDNADTLHGYKSLSLVERALRCIKNLGLQVRPVYHWLAAACGCMCSCACWPGALTA